MPKEENNAVEMEAMDEMNEGCVDVVKPANNFVGRIVYGFVGMLIGIAGTLGVIAIRNTRAAKKEQEPEQDSTKSEEDDELEGVDFSEFDETED